MTKPTTPKVPTVKNTQDSQFTQEVRKLVKLIEPELLNEGEYYAMKKQAVRVRDLLDERK